MSQIYMVRSQHSDAVHVDVLVISLNIFYSKDKIGCGIKRDITLSSLLRVSNSYALLKCVLF